MTALMIKVGLYIFGTNVKRAYFAISFEKAFSDLPDGLL
jgi:hypothetical protein